MNNDNAKKIGEVHGDVFVKLRYESLEEQDDTDNKLDFEDLCNYIGIPVFVIYPEQKTITGIKPKTRSWKIVAGVKKTEAHEYVLFRGRNDWLEIDKLSIYPDYEVANESA